MGALDGWRFCPICGEAIEKVEDRAECRACGYVGYANAVPGTEAVCFDAQGRVLLGRRAYDPRAGLWDLPGGFLHEDELPLDGLRREIREETALEIEPVALAGFREAIVRDAESRVERHFIILCFAARWRAGEVLLNEELDEARWLEPAELASLPTTAGLAEIVAEAFDRLAAHSNM